MQINQMLTTKTMNLNLACHRRDEVIAQLAQCLYADGRLNSMDGFIDDVIQRESVDSTNMGIGVAIPHGKTDHVLRPSIAIGRSAHPIQWDEDEPVHVVMMLAVPESEKGTTHLQMIAKMATLLLEEDFVHDLMTLEDVDQLLQSIKRHIDAV